MSSQLFYLGGAAFGPGYYSGDDGLAGLVEIRFDQTVSSSWLKAYQIYGFLDGGEVWNSGQEGQHLASAGIGVRVRLFDEVYAGLAYAVPVARSSETDEFRSSRLIFSLSSSLKVCPDRTHLSCF
jgi:hemolysin activation/secretion protein